MSDEIHTPSLSPSETNGMQPLKKKPTVSTWVGFIIVLLIVVAFLILFWKFRQLSVPAVSQPASVSQIQLNATSEDAPLNASSTSSTTAVPVQSQNATTPAALDTQTKELDETMNSINDSDFNSGDFSDLEVGL